MQRPLIEGCRRREVILCCTSACAMQLLPLRNPGNSCYANSVLQLVRSCIEVVEALRQHVCSQQTSGSAASGREYPCLLCQLRDDFAVTRADVPSIWRSIGRFDNGSIDFSRGGQQDAHEFWTALNDCLRETWNPFARSSCFGLQSALVCSRMVMNFGLLKAIACARH